MAPSVKEACKPSGFKRQSKYATLVMNKDVEIGKRRNVFLGKVKQNGEVKKWKVRGEQVPSRWPLGTSLQKLIR